MIWSDFVTAVDQQLSVDANRRGLEDFRAQQIKNAVIDLQRNIETYRRAQVTIFHEIDMVLTGYAQIVEVPKFARPTAFYIFSTNPSDDGLIKRNRLDLVGWLNRQSMITGKLPNRAYRYAISPSADQVMIYPSIKDAGEQALLMTWDGYKTDYADDDLITMPYEAAEAVALYVKMRIVREVDKNLQLAQSYQSDYLSRRLGLYKDAQERHDAEKPDDEFPDGIPVISVTNQAFSDGFSLGFS